MRYGAGMFPVIEPYAHGRVENPDGDRIYWETSGNPRDARAWLHGGPGSGLGNGNYRKRYDPDAFRLSEIDQRGCGRSTPLIVDALDRPARQHDGRPDRRHRTGPRGVGDRPPACHGRIVGLDARAGLRAGASQRVEGIVLGAVTTTGHDEVEWLTETMGRIFPEAWESLRDASHRRPANAWLRRTPTSSVPEHPPSASRRPTPGTRGRRPTSPSTQPCPRPAPRRPGSASDLRHPRRALLGERGLPAG